MARDDDFRLALAAFADRVAEAAHEFAVSLRASARPESNGRDGSENPPASGSRQQILVQVPGLDTSAGLKVAEIAGGMGGYDVANTHLTLRALEKRGVVELVPDSTPQRWRLTARYRKQHVWSRDELILTYKFFNTHGASGPERDLAALKDKLDRIALRDGFRGRSIGAINYKLGNFLAIDTDGAEGFPHYGATDKQVVEEYGEDAAKLDEAVGRIEATLD